MVPHVEFPIYMGRKQLPWIVESADEKETRLSFVRPRRERSLDVKAGSVVAIVIASWWLATPVQAGGKLAKCVIRIGPERSNVECSGDCLFFHPPLD